MEPPPGAAAPLRTELVVLLQRHSVEAVQLGRVFAERHDLHPTDWAALLAVVQGDCAGRPLTPGDLGERLGVSSGATTAVVDRLESAGHLRRVRDPRDRRRLTLHRAGNAHALLRAFLEPLEVGMEALTAGYSAPELETVHRFLSAAVGQVRDHRLELAER